MSALKQLKKVLRNPKETYLSWVLIISSNDPPGVLSFMDASKQTLLDFRVFDKMHAHWLRMADTLEGSDTQISAQVRALSRKDGSVVASVGIGNPDEADVYHAELETEGYIHERVAHLLKTCPEPFKALRQDRKRFEIRKDDRPMGFGIDDELRLAHWDPDLGIFMGDVIVARVTYITDKEEWGLQPGHVVMGLVLQEYLPHTNPSAQMWIGFQQPEVN